MSPTAISRDTCFDENGLVGHLFNYPSELADEAPELLREITTSAPFETSLRDEDIRFMKLAFESVLLKSPILLTTGYILT